MLFETQSENLGRQVNVPISRVLLYEIIHHPVEEQTAVKHHDFRTARSQRQTKTAFSDLT